MEFLEKIIAKGDRVEVFYWENKKGTPRTQCDGYFFRINSRTAKSIHWSCCLRGRFKCKASLSTFPQLPNQGKLRNPVHNHSLLDYTNCETLIPIMDKMKMENNYFDDI